MARRKEPALTYRHSKPFQRQLNELLNRGGQPRVVGRQVLEAIHRWQNGQESGSAQTNHGESRIAHAVKYDLRWRDAFQLYVGMTRARDELTMTFVHNRTILIRSLQDTVDEELAASLLS